MVRYHYVLYIYITRLRGLRPVRTRGIGQLDSKPQLMWVTNLNFRSSGDIQYMIYVHCYILYLLLTVLPNVEVTLSDCVGTLLIDQTHQKDNINIY